MHDSIGEPNDETNWVNIGKKKIGEGEKKCLISYVCAPICSFSPSSIMHGTSARKIIQTVSVSAHFLYMENI